MVFREAPSPEAVVTIVHGPFRPRWARIAFATTWLVVFGGLSLIGGRTTTLRCGATQCVVEESLPVATLRHEVIERRDVLRVVTTFGRGLGALLDGAAVMVLDRRGREHVVARRSDIAAAEADKQTLQTFLQLHPPRATMTLVSAPGAMPWVLGALALLVSGLVFANATSTAGRVRIEVDRAHDELRAVRTWLLWRAPPFRASLGDVVDVVLEHGPLPDRLRVGQLPEIGGRLAVVDRQGMRSPLSRSVHRGDAAHARALLALRTALGLPAVDVPRPDAGRVGRGAVGWRVMLLFFAFLVGATFAGNAFLTHQANEDQGWLEVRADRRCRFQGAELLPGGMFRMSLDPGSYAIDVWDGGSWQRQTVKVRKAEATFFVCGS